MKNAFIKWKTLGFLLLAFKEPSLINEFDAKYTFWQIFAKNFGQNARKIFLFLSLSLGHDIKFFLNILKANGLALVGILYSSFLSGSNACPKKPCLNIKTYQAISGLTTASNITFINYNNKSTAASCVGANKNTRDYAIATNTNKWVLIKNIYSFWSYKY